jgi:hypothetical protein
MLRQNCVPIKQHDLQVISSKGYSQYTVQKNIEKDRALQLSTIEYQSLKPYSEAELKALGKEFLN